MAQSVRVAGGNILRHDCRPVSRSKHSEAQIIAAVKQVEVAGRWGIKLTGSGEAASLLSVKELTPILLTYLVVSVWCWKQSSVCNA